MKHRMHIHHLISDKHIYSDAAEMSEDEIKKTVAFFKSMASEGTYFSFDKKDGTSIVIAKEILRNSVFYLEKVEE